jgi:hypothetical protein
MTTAIPCVDSSTCVNVALVDEAQHRDIQSNHSVSSSVLHLTTAIDDDDDELFSKSHRRLPTDQVRTVYRSKKDCSTHH